LRDEKVESDWWAVCTAIMLAETRNQSKGTMAPSNPKSPKAKSGEKPAKARPQAKARSAMSTKAATAGTAVAKAPVAKTNPAVKPTLTVVEKPAALARPAATAPALKLKDLVERVAAATGAKKPEAKRSVEAVLAAISAALKSGADLSLPPLGKLRIARTTGSVLTLKLRQAGAGKGDEKAGAKPLADDGEDD
jgi:DNA-binding protein HU-alpha